MRWSRVGGVHVTAFQAVMTFDPIAMGYAGVALVAYMSTLTSLGYTATQYALLTSALALTGKFLKGFSGAIVEALQQGRSLLDAFAIFYLLAAALGIPAIAALPGAGQGAADRGRSDASPAATYFATHTTGAIRSERRRSSAARP